MWGWWRDLSDLMLPADCGGCGRPRAVLCAKCRAVLGGAAPRRVRPVPEPPGLPVVHAVTRYADEVRAMLLAHKERGALALAAPLGTALAGAVQAGLREVWGPGLGAGPRLGPGPGAGPAVRAGLREAGGLVDGVAGQGAAKRHGGVVMLVPVPSSRGVIRARGHDPTRRIALAAAAELRRAGTPARVVSVLRQGRAVADQAGLNSRQRLENLAGALVMVPGGERLLSGGRVVLVDDLMTTGASLAEAARAVRAARAAPTEEAVSGGGVTSGCDAAAYGGLAGPVGRRDTAARRDMERTPPMVVGGEVARAPRAVAGGGASSARSVRAGGGPPMWGSGADVWGEGATVVYGGVGREGGGERTDGATEEEPGRVVAPSGMAGAGGDRDVICAAVVAATPDSFEINRN